jgi:hypothetical protein
MNDSGGKDYGTPGLDNGLLLADLGSKSSLLHDPFFTFVKMYV